MIMSEEQKKQTEQFKAHVIDMARYMKQKLSEKNPTELLRMEIFTRSGGGKPDRYVINIAGKEFTAEDTSTSEISRFSRALLEVADKLNNTRGYHVCKMWEEFWYEGRDVFGSTMRSMRIVRGITLHIKPCKEFEALRRTIRKNSKYELGDLELFSVAIVGKRGTNYTESRKRDYYAFNPKKCLAILEWIRLNKRLSESLHVSVDECNDCEDQDYSREYETESYGTKHQYLTLRLFRKDGSRRATAYSMYM